MFCVYIPWNKPAWDHFSVAVFHWKPEDVWKKPGCQKTCAVGWRRFGRLAGAWGSWAEHVGTINSAPLRCAGRFFLGGNTHFSQFAGHDLELEVSKYLVELIISKWGDIFFQCSASSCWRQGSVQHTAMRSWRDSNFQNNWLSTCNHATNKRRLIGLPSTFFLKVLSYC